MGEDLGESYYLFMGVGGGGTGYRMEGNTIILFYYNIEEWQQKS